MQDYRDEVPSLHDPDLDRHVRVAVVAGEPAGYVAWKPDVRPRSVAPDRYSVSSAAGS